MSSARAAPCSSSPSDLLSNQNTSTRRQLQWLPLQQFAMSHTKTSHLLRKQVWGIGQEKEKSSSWHKHSSTISNNEKGNKTAECEMTDKWDLGAVPHIYPSSSVWQKLFNDVVRAPRWSKSLNVLLIHLSVILYFTHAILKDILQIQDKIRVSRQNIDEWNVEN